MEHQILYQPSFSLLKCNLKQGDSVLAEGGVMVSMTDGIQLETGAKGGIFQALGRKVLGGESFFMNTFTATRDSEVTFAPPTPGDITCIDLNGRTVFAQSGAFLASSGEVDVNLKWGGAKTFFSREGLFLLRISGMGKVFLSSFGAIHAVKLGHGEKYLVDTGHMVAFDEGVQYSVRRVGGLKSFFFSGEGLVCELIGPGNILIQTRSADAFLSLVAHSGKGS